jgi:hypothetical protein
MIATPAPESRLPDRLYGRRSPNGRIREVEEIGVRVGLAIAETPQGVGRRLRYAAVSSSAQIRWPSPCRGGDNQSNTLAGHFLAAAADPS